MPPRRRPDAFEVSFGVSREESLAISSPSAQGPVSDATIAPPRAPSSSSIGGSGTKRKDNPNKQRATSPKRARPDELPRVKGAPEFPDLPHVEYRRNTLYDDVIEDDLLVLGEDGEVTAADGQLPKRILDLFAVYDVTSNNAMVSLNLLKDPQLDDQQQICVVGFVEPLYEHEEDRGQEDDEDGGGDQDDDQDSDSPGRKANKRQRILLRSAERCRMGEDHIVWLTTKRAHYALDRPDKKYEQHYNAFYAVASREVLARQMRPSGAQSSATEPNFKPISTPLVGILGKGLFPKKFEVIGPRPPDGYDSFYSGFARWRELLEHLTEVSRIAHLPRSYEFNRNYRPSIRAIRSFYQRVDVYTKPTTGAAQCTTYHVGDTFVTLVGKNGSLKAPDLDLDPRHFPHHAQLANYFWFGRIISLDSNTGQAHVRYFEHSSKTVTQELHHPQELFFTPICAPLPLELLVAKVDVEYPTPNTNYQEFFTKLRSARQYFCRFEWDAGKSTVTDMDFASMDADIKGDPRKSCSLCRQDIQRERESEFFDNKKLCMGYKGIEYHLHDHVLFSLAALEHEGLRPPRGLQLDHLCGIGMITEIRDEGRLKVTVQLFGRISMLSCLPSSEFRDERHLYATNETYTFNASSLIQKCYIYPTTAIDDIASWCKPSVFHFYCSWRFSTLLVQSWSDKRRVLPDLFPVCATCFEENATNVQYRQTRGRALAPLRTLDLCAGVGGLGHGLEQGGAIKITHAIEINYEACRTLQQNSTGLTVYHQDINAVLKQAIKLQAGQTPPPLKNCYGSSVLPRPPAPHEIDCIIVGFPCQPHSTLNIYRKRADDRALTIIPILSWIEYASPRLVVMENVRGFLSHVLRKRFASEKIVKEVPMGGLKFIVHALVSMGYQVRFGLLQAAHYGNPQTRIRFFLIAAMHGHGLPEMPEPTHRISVSEKSDDSKKQSKPSALEIRVVDRDPVARSHTIVAHPVDTSPGRILFPSVTPRDAIGDLPEFDWKHPNFNSLPPRERHQAKERARIIPALQPRDDLPNVVGIRGDHVQYRHEPRTPFQRQCREGQPTRDIQHYTRAMLPDKVARVLSVPLTRKADYRGIPKQHQEWGTHNPLSAQARLGFRPGLYGRIAPDEWFQTTVTNMDPTAKQSRVLHYDNKRMLTVRELARTQGFPDNFVFYSTENRIVPMHRQIGNAVPWQLAAAIGRKILEIRIDSTPADTPFDVDDDQMLIIEN